MNSEQYQTFVAGLSAGKRLPTAQYLHRSLLGELPIALARFIESISRALKLDDQWNLVKLHRDEFKVSYLSYPDFESAAYPALEASYIIDLNEKKLDKRDYSTFQNKPILHRKETLVTPSHPLYEEFCLITQEGEQAGMYDDTSIIGYSHTWEILIKQRGYTLVDGRLFRESGFNLEKIDREKTAISRYFLSTPFQLLRKAGLVDVGFSYLDYGCGRGDDLNILLDEGCNIIGWDPYHRPEELLEVRDIVNLGFVINVIEDRDERGEALRRAYDLSQKLLVVSAMIATDKHISKFKPYRDGVITSRNTFQKYFTQDELREYIEDILGVAPISFGQGVFGIFKDDELANTYLESKYKRKHSWNRARGIRLTKEEKVQKKIETKLPLLEKYWQKSLQLGRFPQQGEFMQEEEISNIFSSWRQLNSNLLSYFGEAQFIQAEREVKEDLVLVQAMSAFSGRRVFKHLNLNTQNEIRYFFTNYKTLQNEAESLFETLGSIETIETSAISFYNEHQSGYLDEGRSLTIHKRCFDALPAVLRAYVGCALQLYDELEVVDLIKIHFRSGKVSFMGYENFASSPIPELRERIKVNLWRQRVEFFDYVGEYRPKPLYWKSKFIDETVDDYAKQRSFDDKLALYGFAPKNPSFGPERKELDALLVKQGLQIRGYRFFNSSNQN